MLSNLKLGLRLAIGFGVLLGFLILVSLFALRSMNTLNELTRNLYRHPFAVQRATLSIQNDVLNIHQYMQEVVLSRSAEELNRAVQDIQDREEAIFDDFSIVEDRFLGAKEMYQESEKLIRDWRPIRAKAISLVRQGEYEQAAAIVKGQGNDQMMKIQASVNALETFAANMGTHYYSKSQKVAARTFELMLGLIVVAIGACVLMAWLIARSVARPARQIAAASTAIAGGDLDHHIEYQSRDELGQMADSLRHMIKVLTDINASLRQEVENSRQAQKALIASEERYRSVLEDQTEVICRFKVDGTLVFVNEAYCRLYGKSAEELLGSKWQPGVVQQDLALIEQHLALLSPENQTVVIENRVFDASGRPRWMQFVNRAFFDNQGRMIEIQAVGRDIQDRKQAEEELKRYREHLEDVVLERTQLLDDVGRIAQIGGWEMDLISRKATWTAATYRIVELEPGDPIPGPDEHINWYLPEYRPMIREAMRALEEEDRPLDFEAELKTARGNIRWCRAIGRAIRKDGQAVRLVGTFQDITAQKKLEEERLKMEQALRQAQKMESIGTLAGGIAHDFNNILTAVMGYSEIIQDELVGNDNIRDYTIAILDSSKRAKKLVQQLLAFSRKQVLEMKAFPINEVVIRNHSMIATLIGEDIAIQTFLDQEAGLVQADFNQLEQVLLNLAVNARDAMADGGELTFETAKVYLDEEYANHHAEVTPGNYAMMAVSDNGPGIDPAIMDHIFDPFFTTKEIGKGTGMGLAMIHGIVKQHKGHIYVYSEKDRGTTFKIYLPCLEQADKVDELEESKTGRKRPGGNETILLVEDETLVRDFLAKGLMRLGYKLLEADNGRTALELMDREGKNIGLLLTDVVMPKMSGKDLYLALAKQRPDLKVLYMSGYTKNVIAHQGVLDRGVSFIPKPISLDDLAVKIRKVLEG